MDRYGVWGAQISTPINRAKVFKVAQAHFGGYQGSIHINATSENGVFVPERRFLFVGVFKKRVFRACGNEWEACEGL